MAEVLRLLGSEHAMVVHGKDGLDELSISGASYIWELKKDNINSYSITPEDAGLTSSSLDTIKGGSPEDNAATLHRVLKGEIGPIRDVVLLNTAAALIVGNVATDFQEGVNKAADSIDSRSALSKLNNLVQLSRKIR